MSKEECCTCSDRLNYIKLCEKYDQLESVHEVLVEDNLTYENQIADLEAKLAEKEYEADQRYKDWQEEIRECDGLRVVLAEVRKQLSESEKKHLLDEKEWQDYCAFKHIEPQIKGCLDREKEYEKQLAEKDEEIEKLKDESVKYYCAAFNYKEHLKQSSQDKISFAVEQLEKVKEELEFNSNNNEWITARDDRILNGICNFIDNQIKQLKEGK